MLVNGKVLQECGMEEDAAIHPRCILQACSRTVLDLDPDDVYAQMVERGISRRSNSRRRMGLRVGKGGGRKRVLGGHFGCVLQQILSAVAIMVAVVSAQKVFIMRPANGERVESREVNFEISTADFNMPEEGKVVVYVNEVRAFEIEKPFMSVKAPMEAGFHCVEAFLVDELGDKTEISSGETHFLVDYHDPPRIGVTGGGYMPLELGRVSVVIASHDRYDLLMESIESVKHQTYDDFEIIVVNDASVDERYYALIEDVMMIHLPYNIGRPGLVRNVGIAAASGEFVAFLDDDDVWLPDKLAHQLSAMQAHGANISCSDAFAGNGSYTPTQTYKRWLRDYHGPYAVHKVMQAAFRFGQTFDMHAALELGHCENAHFCLPDVWDWSMLVRANFVITTSVVVRRDLLFAVGPFNNKTLGEDHDMWKMCLRKSPLVFVREALVYWRIDSPNKLTQSNKE